jgi:hypothetical protein
MANWRQSSRAFDVLPLAALPLILQAPDLLGLLHADPSLVLSGLYSRIHTGLGGGTPGYLDPNSAWTAQSLGHLAAEQWLHGRVPWWNPYSGVGAPLAAEMQPAALFLPFILLMHFRTGWLWLHIIWQAIAGIGALALLRRLGLTRAACLAGAVLYGCNGTAAWFSHGPERVAAFLPWLLLGVEHSRTSRRGAATIALALAASLYAGWPETAYLDGLLVAAWALLRLAEGPERAPFAGAIALGLIAGLLLAAPALWPFLHYLTRADTGIHAHIAHAALPTPGLALLYLPTLYGPLDSTRPFMDVIWGTNGGYIGVAASLLAIAALLGHGRELALRWLLAITLILCIARTAGIEPIVWLSNLLPWLAQAAFHRYIDPVLSMAAAVLAAFAVQDWQTAPAARRRLLLVALAGLALTAAALLLARPIGATLFTGKIHRAFLFGSLAWVGVLSAALALLLAARASPARSIALLALILADAGGAVMIARLPAPHVGRRDTALVSFLRSHVGLARTVSSRNGLGRNEGAALGIATVDETMLPVPRLWADHVTRVLHADPIDFNYAQDGPARLARDAQALRGLGVGWLIAGPGYGPLHGRQTVPATAPHFAHTLSPGATLSGTLPAGIQGPGAITTVGVEIGTYSGAADGALQLTLTWPGGGAHGQTPLAGATDNAPLDITLDHPLPPATTFSWTLTHTGGTHAVALWLYGNPAAPRFTAALDWPGGTPTLAFHGTQTNVWRIPNPAPYWSAPGCQITQATRRKLRLTCPKPSTLLRRELFFPGWTATLNGAQTPLRQDGLFERIALPAGPSTITFAYAPPFIGWAAAAGLAGLVLTLGLALPRGRKVRGFAPEPPLGAAPPDPHSLEARTAARDSGQM